MCVLINECIEGMIVSIIKACDSNILAYAQDMQGHGHATDAFVVI